MAIYGAGNAYNRRFLQTRSATPYGHVRKQQVIQQNYVQINNNHCCHGHYDMMGGPMMPQEPKFSWFGFLTGTVLGGLLGWLGDKVGGGGAPVEKQGAEIASPQKSSPLQGGKKVASEEENKEDDPKIKEKQIEKPKIPEANWNIDEMVCHDDSGKTQDIKGKFKITDKGDGKFPKQFTITDSSSGTAHEYTFELKGTDDEGRAIYSCTSMNGKPCTSDNQYTLEIGENGTPKLTQFKDQNNFSQGLKFEDSAGNPQKAASPANTQKPDGSNAAAPKPSTQKPDGSGKPANPATLEKPDKPDKSDKSGEIDKTGDKKFDKTKPCRLQMTVKLSQTRSYGTATVVTPDGKTHVTNITFKNDVLGGETATLNQLGSQMQAVLKGAGWTNVTLENKNFGWSSDGTKATGNVDKPQGADKYATRAQRAACKDKLKITFNVHSGGYVGNSGSATVTTPDGKLHQVTTGVSLTASRARQDLVDKMRTQLANEGWTGVTLTNPNFNDWS